MKDTNFDKIIEISNEIEELVWMKDITYLEASISWAEDNGYEIETISSIINKNHKLKAKIEEEARNLNFLKKVSKLPL
jgi:hypothetical protein